MSDVNGDCATHFSGAKLKVFFGLCNSLAKFPIERINFNVHLRGLPILEYVYF